ncbi:uncharacterized protein LOC108444532 isoform X1 [Pygocentrus nattereri]|uniref:Immunoglobulin V-set domain-containing protein n=2 Tax=Pygocentrus nattereri TaxID=42514 RepID=A0AAR2JY88_PYGNA|nr:uncharacterized protein LOC108444532 isoform X1 [Pygocentrus nattereri]XP_037398263.1 uncharacterized protein LOC108444532 isoform X1 [Pygocentrus nattereri]
MNLNALVSMKCGRKYKGKDKNLSNLSNVSSSEDSLITSSSLLIMTTVLLILLLTCCAGSLSAQSRIYISVKAGSSAVLPCDWRNKTQSSGERPHIEWRTPSETVFERQGGDQYEGEGYEHRVDVPEDKLLGGDCSLVLKDVRLNDSGPYESYLLERQMRRSLRSKQVFIQAVELSVEDAPEEAAAAESVEVFSLLKQSASSSAQVVCSLSPIIMFIILLNILF